MARYAMKMHLDKTTLTFTMETDRQPDYPAACRGEAMLSSNAEDAAVRDEYMAKQQYIREVGEDGADGLQNDIYLTDDMKEYMDIDVRAGFLLMRNLYLVSEDEAACELIVCVLGTVEEDFPDRVNYVAYNGDLFERVDKTREMIEAQIEFYDNPDYDRLINSERRMLAHLEAREADPRAWMENRRKCAAKRGAFFLRDEAGNVFPIRKGLSAVVNKLDELLKQVMIGKDKNLSPNSRFTISCDFDESLAGTVRLFEGNAEDWKAWEESAAAMEYTDEDFRKLMEGRRDEIKAERVFANYYDRFIRMNRHEREALTESLRKAYRNYWNR